MRMDQELNIFRQGVIKGYLKKIPIIAGLRFATVAVTALSWVALVNNCELAAATTPKPAQTHSCCKSDHVGDKAPVNGNQHKSIECCKGWYPAIAPIAKKAAGKDFSFIAHSYFIERVAFRDASASTAILELDSGPPFASSFAEIVLQRSILAHAPPYLV